MKPPQSAPQSTPKTTPKTAMILAAGEGRRMRPITETIPKPLVEIAGRPLIDYALDRMEEAGIETVVVNSWWKADVLEAHLAQRGTPRIEISREAELLDTGGGVKHALAHFGDSPFIVANGDSLWLNSLSPALERLANLWDDAAMDALLMLFPIHGALGYRGPGDFHAHPDTHIRRRKEREVAPFAYMGVQMLHPRLFEGAPDGPFSLNLLYDRAAEAGRLHGMVHDGMWYHVSTPEDIPATEEAFLAGHTLKMV